MGDMLVMTPQDRADLGKLTSRLVSALHPEHIILFGSRAWGTPTKYSDWDLLVIVAHSILPPYQRAVQAHHAIGPLPIPVDVIVKTTEEYDALKVIRGSMDYKIANEGLSIYERGKDQTRQGLAEQI